MLPQVPLWLLSSIVFIASILVAYQFSEKILDWVRFQSIGTRDYIAEKMQLLMIDISPNRILVGQVALSVGLGALMFLMALPNIGAAIFLLFSTAAIGWVLPKPIVDMLYRRRCEAFVNQMVDALGLMSNGMRSGLSVVQAMGLVSQEMPDPIRSEFNLIMSQNKLGVSLEEAFMNLSKRVVADEVEMFVTSVNILKETGGNLAETFDTITSLIRDRIKVEGKIKALTAAAFWQGVVLMCVPPFLGLMLTQTDPEMMNSVFTSFLGWVMLAAVIILEVIAFVVIQKITKIDV
jgi:tight adherence protein B